MPDVMISYARADALDFAGRLALALQAQHVDTWLDTAEIEGGAEWLTRIEAAINNCQVFIAVRTPKAKESLWVRSERLFALNQRKPILPVLPTNCPDDLELISYQPVDFRHSFESAVPQLMDAYKQIRGGKSAPETDVRKLELAYLGKLLLEHGIWQTVYTPMAGVAQLRKPRPNDSKPQMVTVPTGIDSRFQRRLQESQLGVEQAVETEAKSYDDILQAVKDLRRLVVLGDPGAGKTTTLWAIAAHAARRAETDPAAPLPVFVRLSELSTTQTLDERVRTQLGDLTAHYEALMSQKRLLFLLDGLNEMPFKGRKDKVRQTKELVERCRQLDLTAIVSCRELDYTESLDVGLTEKIVITPLDPVRIHRFVNAYITEPSDAGERLFWLLAGKEAQENWREFQKRSGKSFETFWLPGARSSWVRFDGKHWLEQGVRPRSMLQLATNPYMLYMITKVFTEEGELPANRGELFRLFVEFLLLDRERLAEAEANALQDRLADLAYAMQARGEGTTFSRNQVMERLLDEQSLYRALSASLLTGSDELRFTHQLLQEYFAAQRLDREMKNSVPAAQFWPADRWWWPNQWNETALLLAGLYSDNTTPVIIWLADANPELVVRCILESGAQTPPETIEALRPRWLPRLTALTLSSSPLPPRLRRGVIHDPQPEARAAVGRALGLLNLDNRPGVGVIFSPLPEGEGALPKVTPGVRAIPDIEWGKEIPPGTYSIGGDDKAYDPLPAQQFTVKAAYKLAKYPITFIQFQAFLDDEKTGFNDDRWWDGLTEEYRKQPMAEQRFKYANHPRESVSWYQAVAFTRWLTAQYRAVGARGLAPLPDGWEIRLPTEQEWEVAARGMDGRVYPCGNDYDPAKGNTSGIGQTSAVGIFPDGESPFGLLDLSGNVWEWCLNSYDNPEYIGTSGYMRRGLRGSSWHRNFPNARAASRNVYYPYDWNLNWGYRVCTAPITSFDR